MQVAQLPDSHENGGVIPIWRAVCRMVVPGWWSTVSVRPSSSTVTRAVVDPVSDAAGPSAPSEVAGGPGGDAGVNRSMWMWAASTPCADSAPSTRSMNGVGPQT